MKRIIVLLLVLLMVVLSAACTDQTKNDKDTEKNNTPMVVEPTLAVDVNATGIVADTPIDDRKITLGDKEYEFPILVSQLTDNGWYFDENARENLEPVEANANKELYDMNLYHDEYDMRIMLLSAKNESDKEQELRDCYLTKIGINRSMMEDPEKVNIVLPGGVTFKSTAADVLRIYGPAENNPNFFLVELNGSSADYIGEDYTVNMTFFEDGTIEYICFGKIEF